MTREEALEYVNNMWMYEDTKNALETLIPEFGKAGSDKVIDYEEKYNEALERAKKLTSDMTTLQKIREFIFPELAESEDERIRKALIDGVRQIRCKNGITQEQMIAYLERQKEPIPIPDKFSGLKSLMLQYFDSAVHRNDDAEIESDTDLFGRKILDYVWKYSDEQKEQKPWKVGANAYFTPEQKPAECIEDSLKFEEGFKAGRESGLRDGQKYVLNNLDSYGLCKPTEWSEEDKEKIVTISEIIEHCTTIPYSGGTLTLNKEYKKELLCFIRTLRPSWKPSEVQMDALEAATVRYQSTGLESLYEELKKLM